MPREDTPLRVYTKRDLKRIPPHVSDFLREVRDAEPRVSDWLSEEEKDLQDTLREAEQIVTVFVCAEPLDKNLLLDKRYSKVRLSRTAPMITVEARMYWWGRYGEFRKIIDKECEGLKGVEFDECVDRIVRRVYPKVKQIAMARLRFHLPLSYREKSDLIYKIRWRYESQRRYDLPEPLNRWDSRTNWEQFYFAKVGEKWIFGWGDPASTGARATHSLWSSTIVGMDIPKRWGIILWYDDKNRLWFVDEFDSPVICPLDAFGHIKYVGEDFRRFIKKALERGFYTVYFSSPLFEGEYRVKLYRGYKWWYDWLER